MLPVERANEEKQRVTTLFELLEGCHYATEALQIGKSGAINLISYQAMLFIITVFIRMIFAYYQLPLQLSRA
jgi:hypothetical protein